MPPSESYTDLQAARQRIEELEQMLQEGRRHCQELENRLAAFIQHIPMSVAMFDREMRYMMVSDQYLRDYRPEEEEIIGQNHYEVFPDVPANWREAHQRCLMGASESCEEDEYQTRSGRVLYIDWVVQPWFVQELEVGGLILISEIVNDRVEDKQKMAQLNRELHTSNQKLQAYAEAVSHLLREPMKSSYQQTKILKENLAQLGKEETETRVDMLRAQLLRMRLTLQEIYEFAQDQHSSEQSPISLREVLGKVMGLLQHQISQRHARILYGPLPTVFANEFEMTAIFHNLISNAIAHQQGDSMEIRVGGHQTGRFLAPGDERQWRWHSHRSSAKHF
ncbi:MAG: PAS domain-containing protein [Bacteroidota bacterium]